MPKSSPLLIAEIGFNHEGDMDAAKQMIKAAADAGADLVKFQTYRASDLALPSAPHFELIKSGELSIEQMKELAAYAEKCGAPFFSTPFSLRAVDELEEVGVPIYKIASMDLTNKPLLARIAATSKPVIISCGMATLEEIDAGLVYLKEKGVKDIALLHCISEYPAPASSLNLTAMNVLRERYDAKIGYSDHYPGVDACLAAFFLGAEVIETHFTLDTKAGGDHAHSADPVMLAGLVQQMKASKEMMGDKGAFFQDRPDRCNAPGNRRGVYAARDIKAGETLTENDLLLIRPANDLEPNDLEWLVGSKVQGDIAQHQGLKRADVQEA